MPRLSLPLPAVVTCVAVAWFLGWPGGGGELAAQRPAAPGPRGGPLWLSDSPLDDGRRLLVVVDSETRHAAVYHVDPTGTLTLKSARDISWDLLLDEFNGQEPKPATLRAMLQAAPGGPAAR